MTITFFSATINVTYPAGSTCTATDGTTTLTAPDTSGTWVCVVPNVGTWTVSCTDGTQTASTTVSITIDGQSANVKLAYDLRLFDNGDECVSVTGGWTNAGYTYSSMLPEPPEISDGRIQLYGKPGDFADKSVTVAGLLTGKDMFEQLVGKELGDELIIPENTLRADEAMFLDDMTPAELSEKLGVPIRAGKNDGGEFIREMLGIE